MFRNVILTEFGIKKGGIFKNKFAVLSTARRGIFPASPCDCLVCFSCRLWRTKRRSVADLLILLGYRLYHLLDEHRSFLLRQPQSEQWLRHDNDSVTKTSWLVARGHLIVSPSHLCLDRIMPRLLSARLDPPLHTRPLQQTRGVTKHRREQGERTSHKGSPFLLTTQFHITFLMGYESVGKSVCCYSLDLVFCLVLQNITCIQDVHSAQTDLVEKRLVWEDKVVVLDRTFRIYPLLFNCAATSRLAPFSWCLARIG